MSDDYSGKPDPFDSNPYAQPAHAAYQAPMGSPGKQPGLGYVNQITVLGILTLVQGGLFFLMSLFYLVYGVFLGNVDSLIPDQDRGEITAEEEFGLTIVFWAFLGLGAIMLTLAVMHFVAGYRNLYFRGRVFSLVTWGVGLLSIISCYCLPTGIGLAVYGFIVFMNPATAKAFEYVKSGKTIADTKRMFY